MLQLGCIMPLRTKLHTHIFADNEHWSWQKFAVKRDKSVQFMKKRKEKKERRRSEATSGPRAFVSGHFYSMTYHAPSVCNDTAGRCFTLCQKCTRSFFFFFSFLTVQLLPAGPDSDHCHNMLRLWLFLSSVPHQTMRPGPQRHDPVV